MSDSIEKLQQELQAAQREVSEAEARCERHDAEHRATAKELEDNRSALLFMLEDLASSRKSIELSHREWMAALDVINDPIFMHDREFRLMRCNRAYQQCAGVSFKELIGQTYYEVFPKIGAPLPGCLRAMEKAEEEEEEEEDVVVGKTIYRSRAFPIRDEQGVYLSAVHTLEDITESRRAQAILNESKEKFRKISESAQDAIVTADDAGIIVDWNAAAERMFGHTRNEVIGQPLTVMMPERFQHPHREGLARVAAGGAPHVIGKAVELAGLRKDGSEFPLELSLAHWQVANVLFFTGIIRDITKRKRAEEALQLRAQLLDSTTDSVFVHDFDGNFVYLNEAAWKSRGYTLDELMGMNLHELDTPEHGKIIDTRTSELMEKGSCIFESAQRRKDGSVMPIEVNARIIESGGRKLVLAAARDITERRQSETTLKERNTLIETLLENAPIGFAMNTMDDGRMVYVSREFATLYGVPPGSLESVSNFFETVYRDPVFREQIRARVMADISSGDAARMHWEDVPLITAGGEKRFVCAANIPLPDQNRMISTVWDVTDRHKAADAIQHANRALTALSTVNRSLVRATDENELLHVICRAIVEHRGYRVAWVGYRLRDENKSVRVMASAGHVEGFLDTLQISWGENERGMGPIGRAIRSGQTQVCRDLVNDPVHRPWREEALKRGYAASIALPLADNSEVFGVLVVYAGEAGAFDASETALLEEMAGDMAFGVHTLHVRHERDAALEVSRKNLALLRKSLEDTVRAIATIVEMRDPYTAGHQVRVADLATAIARQMELPEDQLHAIRLAGTVHDLGKIQIPAEILSKPGRITDIEFSLIRIHPQAGYDILKDIDFPWPIAQMVLQHHERLDGSGYPQGLKGDTILLEARILAVADVVEAISAHRPYRAGLGIETALDEITKNRGIFYDPQVVDACVALFREQGYTFK